MATNSEFVQPNKRAIILAGVAADRKYDFSVRAFRKVDADVSADGVIYSPLTDAKTKGYRPATRPSFAGNVTGTIMDVAASQVIADLRSITADNILSRAEKSNLVLAYTQATASYEASNAKAAQLGGIESARTSAVAAFAALNTYLNGLAPPWADLSQDTPIDPIDFQTAFATAFAALSNLDAMIADRASTTSTWGGVSGTGKPENGATNGATLGNSFGGGNVINPAGGFYWRNDLYTPAGIAAGFTGQGSLASLSSLAYGSSFLTGFAAMATQAFAMLGSPFLRRADGSTTLTELMAITSLGVAGSIFNQGTGATANSLFQLDSTAGNKLGTIQSGATLGAQSGFNIFRTDGTTILTQYDIRTFEGVAGSIFNQGTGATANSLFQLDAAAGTKLTGVESGATAGANLVSNARLDNNGEGYIVNGSVVVTNGTAADPVTRFFKVTGAVGVGMTAYRPVPVGAKTLYLSFWQKKTDAQQVTADIAFLNRDGGYAGGDRINDFENTGLGTWQQKRLKFTVPADAYSFIIGNVTTAAGPTYISAYHVATTEVDATFGADVATNVKDNGSLISRIALITSLGTAGSILNQGTGATANSLTQLDPTAGTKLNTVQAGATADVRIGVAGTNPQPTVLGNQVQKLDTQEGYNLNGDNSGTAAYVVQPFTGSIRVFARHMLNGQQAQLSICNAVSSRVRDTTFGIRTFADQTANVFMGDTDLGRIATQLDGNSTYAIEYNGSQYKAIIDGNVRFTTPAASGQVFYAMMHLANYASGWKDINVATGTRAAKTGEFLFDSNNAILTDGAIKTSQGVAASVNGQADWATYTGMSTGTVAGKTSNLSSGGVFASFANINERKITQTTRADGSTSITESMVVTNLGVAGSISGQSDWATYTGMSTGTVAGKTANLSMSGMFASFLNITERKITQTVRADGSTEVSESLIVTNMGVAAAFTGQDWGATASENAAANSRVAIGANSIVNSGFTKGTNYWRSNAFSVQLNHPGFFGRRNVAFVHPANDSAFGWDSAANFDIAPYGLWIGGSITEAARFALPVASGERVGARVQIACHRCHAEVYILVFNKDGTLIQADSLGRQLYGNGGGQNGENFQPVEFYRDMVAGAAYAQLMIRAWAAGQADPYLFFAEPQLTKMGAGQTVIPAYTNGPADPLADQTGTNIAAGINNQGGLATQDFVGAGNIAASAVQVVSYLVLTQNVICYRNT